MRRFELTDAQWEQVAPLLPPQKLRTGLSGDTAN
jgi:transposase